MSVAGRGQVVLDNMLSCCCILLFALSPAYRVTFLRSDDLQKCQTKSQYVRWGRIDDLYSDGLALQEIKLGKGKEVRNSMVTVRGKGGKVT